MVTLKKTLYYCSECKKVVGHLDDLLFIDEFSHKGFCSEDCIEDFYFPLIKYYEVMEHSLRKKLNLLDEKIATPLDQDMVEEVLTSPGEVYRQTNELQETYYNFIKHYSHSTAIVVTSMYRKEASFVFLTTSTNSKSLINEFRGGEEVRDFDNVREADTSDFYESQVQSEGMVGDMSEEMSEDEDMIFMQLLESKKSKILAEILMKRKDSDISFEDYSGYESCFQETLDLPDEVFEHKDNEGDKLFSYIKTFTMGQKPGESFFYIVICLRRNSDATTTNVYPILALPTIDMEMCQEFRAGTRLTGPLQN